MNAQYIEHVKSAAVAIDQGVINAVYPNAFYERWSQFASYGAEMPKSAAELDALIESAYNVSKVKEAQMQRTGGVRPSSQIARVSDMAKRAANDYGVADYSSGSLLQRYDLSSVLEPLRAIAG